MISRYFAFACVLTLCATSAVAQTVLERSPEHRFQLDFHVPDAALQKMLPQGWEPQVATAGPAKDANLRVIFIDRIGVFDAAGKPIRNGSTQLVYIAIPVKRTGGTDAGQMIIAGVTDDAAEAPGRFGVFSRASNASLQRGSASSGGPSVETEDWNFSTPTGEHLQIHVKYQRGPLTRGGGEVKFCDPADPRKYEIFKTEQGLDITRNATTHPPDHVMEFSYSIGGGKLASLFDGTERILSWDSFPEYDRTVIAP